MAWMIFCKRAANPPLADTGVCRRRHDGRAHNCSARCPVEARHQTHCKIESFTKMGVDGCDGRNLPLCRWHVQTISLEPWVWGRNSRWGLTAQEVTIPYFSPRKKWVRCKQLQKTQNRRGWCVSRLIINEENR